MLDAGVKPGIGLLAAGVLEAGVSVALLTSALSAFWRQK
jgi:hypothetical protein